MLSGLYPGISGKGPWLKLGKKYRLNVKIEKIIDKKHNYESKIYPQNQVIYAKRKCLSNILLWVIDSHRL